MVRVPVPSLRSPAKYTMLALLGSMARVRLTGTWPPGKTWLLGGALSWCHAPPEFCDRNTPLKVFVCMLLTATATDPFGPAASVRTVCWVSEIVPLLLAWVNTWVQVAPAFGVT